MSEYIDCKNITIENTEYVISRVVGRGATSVVYEASDLNGIKYIVKQYNPYDISVEFNDKWELLPGLLDEKKAEKYRAGLKRFVEGAKKQVEVRNTFATLMNSTTNVNRVLEVGDTAFIEMTAFSGASYEKVEFESSLYELLLRIKAISKTIGKYHDNCLLHLDIKPANIFILEDVKDLVLLFDFDSVIEKRMLSNDSVYISYSKEWAAPELTNYRYISLVDERTDIFSIGEILFYRLFHRHSSIRERRTFSKYDYTNLALLENLDSQIRKLITSFFHKTICVSNGDRFSSVEEMIEMLDSMIEMSQPQRSFLISNVGNEHPFFIGRDNEIIQINDEFAKGNVVCLRGMGGIGKSELAKAYARTYSSKYDVEIMLRYEGSWLEMVCSGAEKTISNFVICEGEEPHQIFRRAIKKYGQLVTSRTLIIIDNVFEKEDELIEQKCRQELLDLNCKLLITTRGVIDDYSCIDVSEMADKEDLVNLFLHWYGRDVSANELHFIKKLIEIAFCHTLMIELLAKQTRAKGIYPSEEYERLLKCGIENDNTVIPLSKDSLRTKDTIERHMKIVFDSAEIDEESAQALAILCLLPAYSIYKRSLIYIVNNENTINNLIDSGWVKEKSGTISVHPLIVETIWHDINRYNTFFDDLIITVFINGEFPEGVGRFFKDSFQQHMSIHNAIAKLGGCYASQAYLELLSNALDDVFADENAKELYIEEISKFGEVYISEWPMDVIKAFLTVARYYSGKDGDIRGWNYIKKVELWSEKYSEDLPSTYAADIMDSKAAFCYFDGNYEEALSLFKKSLEEYKRVYDGTDDNLAIAYVSIGDAYFALSKYEEAIASYDDALNHFTSYSSKYKQNLIQIINRQGDVYFHMKNYGAAEYAYDTAEILIENQYGNTPTSLSVELHLSKGVLFMEEGKFDDAISVVNCEINNIIEFFGRNDRNMVLALVTLANSYRNMKEKELAIDMCKKACQCFQNNPDMFITEAIRNVWMDLNKALCNTEYVDIAREMYIISKRLCNTDAQDNLEDIKTLLGITG